MRRAHEIDQRIVRVESPLPRGRCRGRRSVSRHFAAMASLVGGALSASISRAKRAAPSPTRISCGRRSSTARATLIGWAKPFERADRAGPARRAVHDGGVELQCRRGCSASFPGRPSARSDPPRPGGCRPRSRRARRRRRQAAAPSVAMPAAPSPLAMRIIGARSRCAGGSSWSGSAGCAGPGRCRRSRGSAGRRPGARPP